MMKRFAMFVVAVAAAVGFGTAGAAELTGTLKKIQESGSITIGHLDASLPFSYYEYKQHPVGYALELWQRGGRASTTHGQIMAAIARRLTARQMRDAAAFFSSEERQPLRRQSAAAGGRP